MANGFGRWPFCPTCAMHLGPGIFGWHIRGAMAILSKLWCRLKRRRPPLGYTHPTYRPLPPAWDGKLLFSGTEVAPQFGGYLEGALEAADNTAISLQAALKRH